MSDGRPATGNGQPPPSSAAAAPIRVIGCGRWQRRDDQLGLLAVEALLRAAPREAQIETSESPGVDLLTDLDGAELLVLIDAAPATPQLPKGAWRRIELRRGAGGPRVAFPAGRTAGGHELSVAHALELGDALGLLPPLVWVYVIAGADFGYGPQLSDGLEATARQVADAVRTDLAAFARGRAAG